MTRAESSGWRRLVVTLAVVFGWPAMLQGAGARDPIHVPIAVPGFEEADAEFTRAWRLGSSGVRATIENGTGPDGSRAVIFATVEEQPEPRQGGLVQSIDAVALRGQRLRFSAAARFFQGRPDAFLWFRTDDAAGNSLTIVRQPITSEQWTRLTVAGAVPEAATRIVFGAFVSGKGAIAIDDLSFDALGLAGEFQAPARALTSRGLSSLVSLAQLYGRVRYFHPDDRAAGANWDALLWRGIPVVEGATTDAPLRGSLEQVFCPVSRGITFGGRTAAASAPGAELMAWRHTGFGDSAIKSVYASQRELASASLPVATSIYIAGVNVSIPLQLPIPDANAGAASRCPMAPVALPEGFAISTGDRTSRLVSVIVAWSALQHFYPYFDVTRVSWAEQLRAALRSAATDTSDADFERTLQRLVSALRDGHGRVFAQRATGRLPLEWTLLGGKLVVTESDLPSVNRGDVVEKVDGIPVAQLIEELNGRVSAATDGWRKVRVLQEMQAAAPGSTRELQLMRADGSIHLIPATTVAPESAPAPKSRPAAFTELEPGFFYVDLTRITTGLLTPEWQRLAVARGYIFDLRGYPTGPALEVIRHLAAGEFQSDQFRLPIYREPDQRNVTFQDVSWSMPPLLPHLDGNAVFLTDARAISYGESLMGIVEHRKLGTIVGSRTAGTNGNIVSLVLPTGHQVMWTGMQVLKRKGGTLHGVGIVPNIEVEPSIEDVRAGIDTVLEAGLRVLRKD